MKTRRARQRKQEYKIYRRRKKRKGYVRRKNALANRPKEKSFRRVKRKTLPTRRHVAVKLPPNFSFIDNPKAVLKVFAQFRAFAREGTDVLLDFQDVDRITPDAIALLLAKASFYSKTIMVRGNRPKKQEADLMLHESGFYRLVGVSQKKPSYGLLEMHKSKVVDPLVAANARRLAAEKTFGDSDRKIQPLYRTLIECMANTRNHASPDQTINWWLSVYNDPLTKITSFAFCDTGVGIFKSAKIKKLAKFALGIGYYSRKDILRLILEGKVPSSTGLPYRGKGLPKIYSDYKNKHIKRLFIAANDIFADFDSGTFLELEDELNGTFLYWEVALN